MSQGEEHELDEQTLLENNMYEVPSSVINYVDNNNNVMESNTATHTERAGGGYIITGADGNELFVPENRVLPYSMEGDELRDYILNTNKLFRGKIKGIINHNQSINIDTFEDFNYAKFLIGRE